MSDDTEPDPPLLVARQPGQQSGDKPQGENLVPFPPPPGRLRAVADHFLEAIRYLPGVVKQRCQARPGPKSLRNHVQLADPVLKP